MHVKPSRRLGEFALIETLVAPLAAGAPGAFGLRDDAATLAVPSSCELVVTTDAVIEGVHFLRDDPPALVARKALGVNLSDLAAKGAVPEGYLLALCIPAWVGDPWLEEFAAGLAEDQRRFAIHLLGGDTTSTPGPLTLAITAMGTVRRGCTLRRAGAQPGDRVFVTGTIGDAGGGLAVLKGEAGAVSGGDREFLIGRYRVPSPRVALGPKLIGHASAALDVSDGLLADLAHIADVSAVRIVVEAARVPLSPALRRLWGEGDAAVKRAASAGDDYEIAFTAPPGVRVPLENAAATAGVPIHEIGRVENGSGVAFLGRDGRDIEIERPGYTHF
jgi:thiamine-monophosphate kinase